MMLHLPYICVVFAAGLFAAGSCALYWARALRLRAVVVLRRERRPLGLPRSGRGGMRP